MLNSMKFNLLEVIDRVRVNVVPDLAKWLKPIREDVQQARTMEDECRCVIELMDTVRDYKNAMYMIDRLWLTDMAVLAKKVLDASNEFCEAYGCGDVLEEHGLYCCVAAEDGITTFARMDTTRDMDGYGGCVGENGIIVANDLCECQCADDHLPRHQVLTAFGLWVYLECGGNLQTALNTARVLECK